MKKIISVLLCVLLLASLLPVSAFAATTASGTCGDNLTWTLDGDGTLTISGTGAMTNNYTETWYEYSSSIKNVVIDDSVTSIGYGAFFGCSSLTSVTIPDSVTSIGDYAFENCSSLTSVTIPDSVTSIGDYAFFDCSSLTSVTIGNSVTGIGESAFTGCSSLTSITIPNSVSKISYGTFERCENLKSVTIPTSVKSIGDSAFYGCSSLTSVTIPDSVTSIGYDAFSYCSKIKDAYYNGNIESWLGIEFGGGSSNPCTNGSNLYFNGELVTDVVIPGSITSIGGWAFSGCSSLTSVTIPDSVTSIGYYAFCECSKLKDIAFAGSKDAWASIGMVNEAFSTSPRIHYNCTTLEGHIIPVERKDPSCTSTGYIKYSCACGYEYTELLPQSHDYVFIESVAATCTEAGHTAGVQCSRCGLVESGVTEIPALGHSYGAWTQTKAPTCTAKGTETKTCTRCNASETRDVAALGHDIIPHAAKAATCTEIGWEAYDTCSRCDYTTYKEIPETGHHHDAVVTAPTCTEKGYTTHTCACGDSYVDSYTNALGHSYGAWTQTKAPTCTEKGTEAKTCTRCNATETRDVEALGHNTTHHAAKAATCTEAGWEAYDTCSRCNYTTYKEIPATGHHHNADVTAPTCTAKGYTTHTCACGDSYVDSYTDALGHSYGAWTQTKAPTCTEKGTETKTCTRCNATETRDVEALGHNTTHHAAKAATCTEKGWAAYDTCSRCDYTTYEEIPALGHSYANGKCTRCGAADPNYIAAPALSITTSAGKPKIYWNAVDGAVKYWVYRSTDSKNFKYYDSTTKTSYTNNSTTIGTLYYYKVKAVKTENGKDYASDYSVIRSIRCKPAAPSVSINRSNGKPKLSWKAVSGATKYWIYRSTDGKEFKYFVSTTKTSYTNSGAASGTKYYYRVKAVAVVNGKNVVSANSSTKSLLTSLAKPSVSITTSNGKPKLTWKAVTGADKYYVYRSTDGKNFSYWDSTTKTSYVNSGAKKNTKYYYKVKAVCASNSNANSAQSSAVSIKATK